MFAHSSGGVVLNPKGQVLVVQQRDGSWSLPKGHVKEGEDPKAAAMREIVEETGVADCTLVKILGSYSRYSLADTGKENTASMKRITIYLFIAADTELRPADPRNPAAKWMPKSEVARLLTHPKDKEFFTGVLSEL